MKALVLTLLFAFLVILSPQQAFAGEDPLQSSNNKIGIHILFPSELKEAASLVNSNGGDWGYVTIPIQVNDKNRQKWQGFMDDARTLHLIPIIRLATEPNYFSTNVWTKPTDSDILDFANFLNSLDWPIKNRYVVVFNEPNRADEWQGNPDPGEYARILSYAAEIFKATNPDFFVISAGLDNAAATIAGQSIGQYAFLQAMRNEVSDIFDLIDGLGSHSYPNPGFSQSPYNLTQKSISSFSFEKNLVSAFTYKDLPVFITETGWSQNAISDSQIAAYYKDAFSSIWANNAIVAITPFLLRAGAGPFTQFSFLDSNQNPTHQYRALESLPKVKGNPVLAIKETKTEKKVLGRNVLAHKEFFAASLGHLIPLRASDNLRRLFKWFLGI